MGLQTNSHHNPKFKSYMPSIHKIDLEHMNEEKNELVRVRYTKIA